MDEQRLAKIEASVSRQPGGSAVTAVMYRVDVDALIAEVRHLRAEVLRLEAKNQGLREKIDFLDYHLQSR